MSIPISPFHRYPSLLADTDVHHGVQSDNANVQWKRISNGRPFVIKGIQCAEDALKALEYGCEGIVVSNHAGRQVDGAVGSLEMLPEIVEAVGGSELSPPVPTFQVLRPSRLRFLRMYWRADSVVWYIEMKIIYDSGIRTGSDVFKAIALGADAVQVGRLYVWGMSHEGETGCRHVMKSLLAVSLFVSIVPLRLPDDWRWYWYW